MRATQLVMVREQGQGLKDCTSQVFGDGAVQVVVR